ncbi:MAG TPA: class I SAM-dependent methyltransferase [Enhygromyxa sp.]|nr:class I SAM-dependent methyltransferase [Enhygromyxa sp.]
MQAPIEYSIDPGSSEAFAERLLELINGGSLAMMVSIGHRTGLFDALAELGAVRSTELATAAGLDERYVREWLGAMVVGRIVEHDGEAGTYLLPDAHAASLCRKSPSTNMAVFAQYLSVLGRVEDEIVECFRRGGGVPYSSYPRFHEVMAEDSGQSVLPMLESAILPLVPGLVDRLRLGVEVLDVGCGRGRALLLLAERFPRSRFVGVDISAEAIDWARAQAHERGLTNIGFEQIDAAMIGDEHRRRYDLITTFDAVHDQRDPAAVLAAIAECLAPGGVYFMQDIASSGHHAGDVGHPLGPLIYTVSCMHCMTVSLAEGGAGLGAAWGRERAEAMLAAAGFGSVVVHQLDHDLQNDYYVCRRSADDIW